jgi:hypothetical protein
VVLFVDFEDPEVAFKSNEAILELEKVHEKYTPLLNFYYALDKKFTKSKERMDLKFQSLPALTFNALNKHTFVYPESYALRKDQIFTWLDDIIMGRAKQVTDKESKQVETDTFSKH